MTALPLIVFMCLPTSAFGDWPQWRGPFQTAHTPSNVRLPGTLPSTPQWRIRIGDGVGSPVVAENKVFYLDHEDGQEVVHAVTTREGREIWKADLDEVFEDSQSKPGPRSTPLVHDGLVYVQSCRGQFKCLKSADGSLVWEKNFKKDFQAPFIGEKGSAAGASRHGNCGSPVVVESGIYVAAGGTNGASIVCLDRKTGAERWRSQSDVAGYGPVLYTRPGGIDQIVHFSAEALIGLSPQDGRLLWRHPVKTSIGRHVVTPVIVGNMVVVSSHQAGLIGVRISGEISNMKSETAWINKEASMNFASPVAVGDYLFGVGPNKNLVCIHIPTGEEKWSQTGLIQGSPSKAYAGFLVAGSRVLMLGDGGQAVIFEADPTGYKELARAQVCGFNWCNPALANGSLFFRDGRNLYRLDLE